MFHHILVASIYYFACLLALFICYWFGVPRVVMLTDFAILLYTLVLFMVSYTLYKYLKRYLNKKHFTKGIFGIAVCVFISAFSVIFYMGVIGFSPAGVLVWASVYIFFSTLVAYSFLVAIVYRSKYEKHLVDIDIFK